MRGFETSNGKGERMANRNFARLGGVCGLLFALLMVPAYVVGSPDALPPASALEDLVGYFDSPQGTFVLANGVLAVFSTFFFLWFLGALHGLIRGAEGEEVGLSSAALAGGTVFIALSCAGHAAEVLYPATLIRFEAFGPGAEPAFTSLVLATWLYHFCQAGAAVMITATSLAALGTGVLPRWFALVGFAVALLTLLHFLLPLVGALAGLLWVALVSGLMLVPSGRASSPRRLAR
jgi:hypothetical protein